MSSSKSQAPSTLSPNTKPEKKPTTEATGKRLWVFLHKIRSNRHLNLFISNKKKIISHHSKILIRVKQLAMMVKNLKQI
jgi:hypothetical protein